jgi:hypothetical protein
MPCVSVPLLVAVEQLSAVMLAIGKTVLSKVQVCPPMLIAKLAVPALAGVPVMVKVKLPEPFAKVPAAHVAVRPVTPVDVKVCAPRYPPFPPVYGTLLFTLEAAMPCASVPLLVAVEQFNAVMLALTKTVLFNVQVCPPMLSAKLAIPLVAGMPVMV